MRRISLFSIALLVGLSASAALAQKPKDPFAPRAVHSGGKPQPPYLARHRGSSAAIPVGPSRTSTGAELAKIEQQSSHGVSSGTVKTFHAKPTVLPKVNVAKGDRNTAINFNGKSATRTTVMTRSKGASRGTKIH